MKTPQQALCLLLLCAAAVSVHAAGVSKEDKDKINKGLEAGKELTDALAKPGFKGLTDSLKKMNDIIGPWVDGIGIFSSVLGMFLPEDTALLDAMKKGFKEVNDRLDDIKEGIDEVKEAIDWAVVKVNFQGIEQDIRLMDEKLKEVIQAPNPDHGEEEFIRVYEDEYNEAGLLLWDSIVNDDQVFSENIVRAGMKYTDYYRSKMDGFMRGMIALIMKSANIELAYESFKDHDRGMTAIWKTRLSQVQQALTKADEVLEYAWKDLFRGEVDKKAKDYEGKSIEAFRDATWLFLSNKYPWNHWFVLAYDPVTGGDKHGVHYFSTYAHVRFRYYGRNYLVGCVESDFYFNEAGAIATVKKDIQCPHSQSKCSSESSYTVAGITEHHGVAHAAIWAGRVGWSVMFAKHRGAWNLMNLKKDTWSRSHYQFQFG